LKFKLEFLETYANASLMEELLSLLMGVSFSSLGKNIKSRDYVSS